MVPELLDPRRIDGDLLSRAFHAADTGGEAALNGLLYASGALLMSAVLLTTTEPVLLAVGLAVVPWLCLVGAAWWWIKPSLRAEAAADDLHRRHEAAAMEAAVAVLLLDEPESLDDRKRAARALLGPCE